MLKNRVVVITGASSGIGQSTAIKLQDQGYIVVWSSRHIQDDLRIQKLLKGRSAFRKIGCINKLRRICRTRRGILNDFGELGKNYYY